MTYTFLKAPPKIPPHPSSWLRNSIATFILFGCCITLNSCYKDTRTCHCARQPRFNLKDDCREAEQFIGAWAKGRRIEIVITYHPDVERFTPEYNPSNENEVAFVLKKRTPDDTTDARIKPQMVIANLSSGEHYFVHELPWFSRKNSISWGRNDHIILNASNSKSYFFETKTRALIDSVDYGLSESTWSYDGKKIVGWGIDPSDRKWSLRVMSWPELQIEESKFKSLPLSATSTIAWSQENEIVLAGLTEVGMFNFYSGAYTLIFESDADIEIGIQANKGGIHPDYEWAPNNRDVFFVNSSGIFRINKDDDKQYRIKKSCPNRQYKQITMSPLGDKLIAQRRDIKTETNGEYISENIKLVIMDVNGCNEEVLFEDWDGVVSGRP